MNILTATELGTFKGKSKILLHVFRHIFFKGRGCSKVMLTFASFFPISYIANFSLEHSRGLQKSKQLAGASRSHE